MPDLILTHHIRDFFNYFGSLSGDDGLPWETLGADDESASANENADNMCASTNEKPDNSTKLLSPTEASASTHFGRSASLPSGSEPSTQDEGLQVPNTSPFELGLHVPLVHALPRNRSELSAILAEEFGHSLDLDSVRVRSPASVIEHAGEDHHPQSSENESREGEVHDTASVEAGNHADRHHGVYVIGAEEDEREESDEEGCEGLAVQARMAGGGDSVSDQKSGFGLVGESKVDESKVRQSKVEESKVGAAGVENHSTATAFAADPGSEASVCEVAATVTESGPTDTRQPEPRIAATTAEKRVDGPSAKDAESVQGSPLRFLSLKEHGVSVTSQLVGRRRNMRVCGGLEGIYACVVLYANYFRGGRKGVGGYLDVRGVYG